MMLDGLFIYTIYGEVERKNISQCLDANKIVFVDITVDWCVSSKFNTIVYLDSIRALGMYQRRKTLQCKVDLIPKMMIYTIIDIS